MWRCSSAVLWRCSSAVMWRCGSYLNRRSYKGKGVHVRAASLCSATLWRRIPQFHSTGCSLDACKYCVCVCVLCNGVEAYSAIQNPQVLLQMHVSAVFVCS